MNTLTARQATALAQILFDIIERYQIEEIREDWISFHFEDEIRPGRGCDLKFFYADGEHVLTGYLDVYGNGSHAIGDVDWIHDSENEECECSPCLAYRTFDEVDV